MKQILSTILFFFYCQTILAQYTLNGFATQDACNAYSLTQAAGNQNGSVWNNNKIDLSQSFDFNFEINKSILFITSLFNLYDKDIL